MSLESQVVAFTAATEELLQAVNTRKVDLDTASTTAVTKAAEAGASAVAAAADAAASAGSAVSAGSSATSATNSMNAAAGFATTASGHATNATAQALAAAGYATTAEVQSGIATTKATEVAAAVAVAEAARDAATVNADFYVDVATGLAAVTEGTQFQVASADGMSIQRYRHDAGPVATPVGVPFPSAAKVENHLEGVRSVNLFNPLDPDVAIGFFPNNLSGVLQANVLYNTTGFIPVIGDESYTFSQKHYVCWYNSSKVFISGTSDSNTTKTQVAPSNATFVRASGHVTAGWPLFQVEHGTTQSDHEPYGVTLDPGRISNNSVPATKIEDGSITPDKTSFLRPGKNMFSKAAATIGYFLGANGEPPSANATWDYSDFIPVTPGQVLKSSHNMRFTTFYSASRFLKAGGSTIDTSTITVPEGVYFVRVTVYHANLDVFQLEEGVASTAYEPYGYNIQGPFGEQMFAAPPPGDSVSEVALQNGSVTPSKTNFLQLGKNLFDKSLAVSGFLGPSGGAITASASYFVSDFISVQEGLPYYGAGSNGMRFTTYYNSLKQVVAGGSSSTIGTFTTPAGVSFVRITISASDLNTFQFEQSASPTEFKPFGYVLKLNSDAVIYLDDGLEAASWAGLGWGSLGDSITAGGTWQPKVATSLGLIWTNYGAGGSKISGSIGDTAAMCQDTRINAMPTTLGLITVLGGTNDWAQNVPIGAVDSADPLTFSGALNTMIQKLCARFPDKRIVLMTTPYGELPARVADGTNNWVNAWTNNLGLTTRDYAEAMRVSCKRWGIPYADVARDAGWNTVNINTYITNDGGLLHPQSVGGGRISSVLLGTLKSIAPV